MSVRDVIAAATAPKWLNAPPIRIGVKRISAIDLSDGNENVIAAIAGALKDKAELAAMKPEFRARVLKAREEEGEGPRVSGVDMIRWFDKVILHSVVLASEGPTDSHGTSCEAPSDPEQITLTEHDLTMWTPEQRASIAVAIIAEVSSRKAETFRKDVNADEAALRKDRAKVPPHTRRGSRSPG